MRLLKYLSILIFFLINLLYAQNFSLFEMDSVKWKYDRDCSMASGPYNFTAHYQTLGDTLIGSNIWKKLYYNDNLYNPNLSLTHLYFSTGTKVFAKKMKIYDYDCQPLDTSTFLAYDYSIQLSDTFFINADYLDDTTGCIPVLLAYKLVQIDTIVLDIPRKRFSFENVNNNLSFCVVFPSINWIEGIGNSFSPFEQPHYSHCFIDFDYCNGKLCRVDTNNIVVISNCLYTSNSPNSDFQLSIYPNPASEKLYIENQELDEVNFTILDLNGKEIFKSVLKSFNEIELYNLKNGIYLLKLEKNKELFYRKLVINQ